MKLAGVYDFTIQQGARLEVTFFCQDPDGTEIDLTGYAARALVRTDAVVLDLAPVITDPAAGRIEIDVPASVTAALGGWRVATWDLEIYTPGDADVQRILEGRVTLSPEATR